MQSPQLDLNNAIPLLRSLVDFLVSFRDRFSEFEDLGQQKSGSSDYKSGRKRTKSVRLTQFEGSAVNTSLPPAEMFRTFFFPIIDGFVTRLEQRIEAYEPVVNLFGFLHKLTLLPHECLQRAASKLIEAYPKDLEPDFKMNLCNSHHSSRRKTSELLPNLLVMRCKCFKLVSKPGIRELFPNVDILFRIYLTLPVTKISYKLKLRLK